MRARREYPERSRTEAVAVILQRLLIVISVSDLRCFLLQLIEMI